MISSNNNALGEILENIDNGVLLMENGNGHRVIYTNKCYNDLWTGSKYFQRTGSTYNYPHTDDLNTIIRQKKTGKKTVELNIGSQIKYYFVYVFPIINSAERDLIVEVSWDITETYHRHSKDSDYKSLFFSLFQVARIPIALVDSNGCISQYNPMFFNTLASDKTIVNGTFIWNLFESRREVKESFEEIINGSSLIFNYEGYLFTAVEKILSKDSLNANKRSLTCSWVLVQKAGESVCKTTPCSVGMDDIKKTIDERLNAIVSIAKLQEKLKIIEEWEIFFKLLGQIADLPWNLIIGGLVTIGVAIGGFSLVPDNTDRPPEVDTIQNSQ